MEKTEIVKTQDIDEAYGSVLAYNLISSDYTSSVMKIYFTKE